MGLERSSEGMRVGLTSRGGSGEGCGGLTRQGAGLGGSSEGSGEGSEPGLGQGGVQRGGLGQVWAQGGVKAGKVEKVEKVEKGVKIGVPERAEKGPKKAKKGGARKGRKWHFFEKTQKNTLFFVFFRSIYPVFRVFWLCSPASFFGKSQKTAHRLPSKKFPFWKPEKAQFLAYEGS